MLSVYSFTSFFLLFVFLILSLVIDNLLFLKNQLKREKSPYLKMCHTLGLISAPLAYEANMLLNEPQRPLHSFIFHHFYINGIL